MFISNGYVRKDLDMHWESVSALTGTNNGFCSCGFAFIKQVSSVRNGCFGTV